MRHPRVILAGTSTLAAGLVATGLVLFPGTAAAGSAVPAAATAPSVTTQAPAAKKPTTPECRQVHRLDQRWAKVKARLSGPATEKGSIAWVKAQAADAAKAGDKAKADKLTKRADKLANRLTTLSKLAGDFGKVATADCG